MAADAAPPPHTIWSILQDWWGAILALGGGVFAQLAAWWGIQRDVAELKKHKVEMEEFMERRETALNEYTRFKTATELTAEHVRESLTRIEKRFDGFDAKLDKLGNHIQGCPMKVEEQ